MGSSELAALFTSCYSEPTDDAFATILSIKVRALESWRLNLEANTDSSRGMKNFVEDLSDILKKIKGTPETLALCADAQRLLAAQAKELQDRMLAERNLVLQVLHGSDTLMDDYHAAAEEARKGDTDKEATVEVKEKRLRMKKYLVEKEVFKRLEEVDFRIEFLGSLYDAWTESLRKTA